MHSRVSWRSPANEELNNQLTQIEDVYPGVTYNSSLVYSQLFAWALQEENDLQSPEVEEFHSVREPLH